MSTSEHILDVNDATFEYEVIQYSQNKPVVVDFWASWCRPCKMMSPILDRLAVEANGAFRLARLDSDGNPNTILRFSVRSLPTIKAFSEGQLVGDLVGEQPEGRMRELISHLAPPSPANLAVEKADSLFANHQWKDAEIIYSQVLDEFPGFPAAQLGLTKLMLLQGRAADAQNLIHDFTPSRFYKSAEQLRPYADTLAAYQKHLLPDETPLDASFKNSFRLVERGNIPAALDGLLDILRSDRNYRNGKARLIFLSLLELLGDEDPTTRQYRAELATVLF
jgi:putative thioredoxin